MTVCQPTTLGNLASSITMKPLVYVQDEHHRGATRPLSCVSVLHVSHVSVWYIFLIEFPLPNLMYFTHALVHRGRAQIISLLPTVDNCAIGVAEQSDIMTVLLVLLNRVGRV